MFPSIASSLTVNVKKITGSHSSKKSEIIEIPKAVSAWPLSENLKNTNNKPALSLL